MLRFGRAYSYHPNLLTLLHEVIIGLRIKRRPEALIFGFSQLLKGWTVMERLSEIRIPTLVLAGRHDFQFPPEHQAILVNRITDAELAIVERAGHNAPMERTAEVIEIIKRFMGVN
jgi:proline iminopeptidase